MLYVKEIGLHLKKVLNLDEEFLSVTPAFSPILIVWIRSLIHKVADYRFQFGSRSGSTTLIVCQCVQERNNFLEF